MTPLSQEQHGIKNAKTCKCGKKFEYPSYLARHLDHHDPKSVKKRFKCQKCDADFSENKSLKRHIKTIHKGKKSQSQINYFTIENAVPFIDAKEDLHKVFNDDLGLKKKDKVPSVHGGEKEHPRKGKKSRAQRTRIENEVPLLSDATDDLHKVLNDDFGFNKKAMVPSVHERKKTYKIPKKQSVEDYQNVPNSSLIENEVPFIDAKDDSQKVLNDELGPHKKKIVLSFHEGQKEFKCEFCKKSFESKKKWFMHNCI